MRCNPHKGAIFTRGSVCMLVWQLHKAPKYAIGLPGIVSLTHWEKVNKISTTNLHNMTEEKSIQK